MVKYIKRENQKSEKERKEKNKRKTIHKTYKYLIVDYNMLKYEKVNGNLKRL